MGSGAAGGDRDAANPRGLTAAGSAGWGCCRICDWQHGSQGATHAAAQWRLVAPSFIYDHGCAAARSGGDSFWQCQQGRVFGVPTANLHDVPPACLIIEMLRLSDNLRCAVDVDAAQSGRGLSSWRIRMQPSPRAEPPRVLVPRCRVYVCCMPVGGLH